jgi:hypothetical protein
VVQADRAADTDEQHQRRGGARVVGEVVGPAGTERRVHGEAGLAQPRPARRGQRLVVDQRGLALHDRDRAAAAVGPAGVVHDLVQRLVHGRAVGLVERAQRAAGRGAAGDHVRRLPGLERPDRDGHRVRGVGPPADDLLQREHHLAQRRHRIGGQVRVPRVPAGALDPDLELVGRRVHGARGRGDRARRNLVLQVRPDDRARLLGCEGRRGHDVGRAERVRLLARLQHGQQRRR